MSERLHLLGDRSHRQADARGDDALDAIDLVLEHELPQPLDRVLRVGLLLDDELDLAAGDAARGVDAVDREHRPAQAALADRAGDPGLGRDDADPQRPVLRECGSAEVWLRGEHGAGAQALEDLPALHVHRCLLRCMVGHGLTVLRVNFSITPSSRSLALAARSSSPAAIARAMSACSLAVSGMSAACL